jgi:lipopolysaccharide transport system permease protein
MWQYRELIRNLTVVDLKNRYQNTALGFFWSLLSPFLLAVVLYFVFSHLFGREENFAINLLVGIMAWRFFATGTSASLGAIVGKPSLVTKVYIPRQILVLSNVLANIISSLLEFIVLLPIIFVLLGHLPVTVLLFPLIHIIYFFFIFGVGLLLSSLFVYFRDVNQIWEVLINVLFFCSPIIYPLTIVPAYLMPYYLLNPITQFIIMYRDVMIAGDLPSLFSIAVVIGFAVAAYLVGSFAFSKLQRRFAEEIG